MYNFWLNIYRFLDKIGVLLPRIPQETSRRPLYCSRGLSGGKLAPRCVDFGPKCPPKKNVFQWGKIEFAPSWPKIRPWRAQEPLPDPPGRVLGTSWGEPGDKRRSRRPQGCKNDLQERPKWPKIDLKMTPKATPNDHQKTLSAFQFSFVYFKNVTHQLTKVS